MPLELIALCVLIAIVWLGGAHPSSSGQAEEDSRDEELRQRHAASLRNEVDRGS